MERSKSEMSGYVVRAPVEQDATDLGRMHCRVWLDTYADSMDPQAYAALSAEGFADDWRRRLSAAPVGRTAVADHATDGIVGFISVGPARDDDPVAPRQVWALNIAVQHHGTGLAQHLMAEVLGDGPAYLWVAHGNNRAISFYQRHGFTVDGTECVDQQDGMREVRMVRHG